ncbi:unnamed protein product [Amoebophrya sp. A25]|nr:unnamed protein product [Amoebophrya sp. A25]|eukprot:GSA25T00007045001.1
MAFFSGFFDECQKKCVVDSHEVEIVHAGSSSPYYLKGSYNANITSYGGAYGGAVKSSFFPFPAADDVTTGTQGSSSSSSSSLNTGPTILEAGKRRASLYGESVADGLLQPCCSVSPSRTLATRRKSSTSTRGAGGAFVGITGGGTTAIASLLGAQPQNSDIPISRLVHDSQGEKRLSVHELNQPDGLVNNGGSARNNPAQNFSGIASASPGLPYRNLELTLSRLPPAQELGLLRSTASIFS